MEKNNNLPECCKQKKEYEGNNPFMGLVYGIIPHIGCIMFIIGSILGATILMQLFRPLLMNRYIFHYLVLISIGFATLSSFLYLKKNKHLSWRGIKKKKGYLSIMYTSTVGINLVLFFLIFPYIANITSSVTAAEMAGAEILNISVDIPCPGHAPLISNEVKTIDGVKGSEYSFPDKFEVYYDPSITSPEEILALEVFEEYPATLKGNQKEASLKEAQPRTVTNANSCSGGCGGTGSCKGSCGSPSCNYNK